MSRAVTLLPGASGQIGIFAIPLLVAAGFRVLALSRRGKPATYPDIDGVEWLLPGALSRAHTESVNQLLSCGPLGLANKLLATCPATRRVIAFSTSSVYSKLDSGDRREREEIAGILAEEKKLKRHCSERDIAMSIFRPTLVYGCGMDRNLSLLARWIDRFGFLPVAGRAGGLRQPVHAHDLAIAAVTGLMHESPLAVDTPICGGSTLSFHDMVSRVFTALGRRPRLVGVPPRLLAMLVSACRAIPAFRGISPEMVRRQAVDLVFDDIEVRTALNFSARPFRPSREDFMMPASAALQALARRPANS